MVSKLDTIRLLLVDNNVTFLRIYQQFLQEFPDFVVVGTAANARQAESAARSLSPHVILIDLNLPEANGLTLISQLRRFNPNVGIVVLTLWATAQHERRAKATGADGFVDKRFLAETLPVVVRSAASRITTAPHVFKGQGVE